MMSPAESTLDSAASFVTLSDGLGISELENVQVTFSPSLRLIVMPLAGVPGLVEPPLGLVTWQARLSSCQPPGSVSVTVYDLKSVMPVKALVFAEVPSSTSEKLASGVGAAAKLKE